MLIFIETFWNHFLKSSRKTNIIKGQNTENSNRQKISTGIQWLGIRRDIPQGKSHITIVANPI
jgi:hypothetical protein